MKVDHLRRTYLSMEIAVKLSLPVSLVGKGNMRTLGTFEQLFFLIINFFIIQ